ncbi:brain and acute leukemia cytoplasmic protein isoform X2 [Oncorhynchus keta]|uniref:brain and acute leukemia cytoplasmic protein isoform X2 n=1 Tax=Oncorhynchus keta TaxID=8018 RepID=UPI00227B1564|nr:brain and acute leukemia cytoplasmic protein isoform X2 [Oncorhynchus keta]
MGCGGSRSDTIIEPRYHESWTRETESTWLTNTDAEAALSTINSKGLEGIQKEKRMMVTTGTQCGKQTLTSSGPNHWRSCHDQTKKESRRRASKEVPAPSKAVQSVSGSEDTVPLSQAGDER